MEEEYEDYEDEGMPIYGEEYDIILLEPYNGSNIGDVIPVCRGIYNTLIDLKKGLPVNCLEDVTNKQKLVMNSKFLEKENTELAEQINELEDKIKILEEKIEKYEADLDLNLKVKRLENKINKLTTPDGQ